MKRTQYFNAETLQSIAKKIRWRSKNQYRSLKCSLRFCSLQLQKLKIYRNNRFKIYQIFWFLTCIKLGCNSIQVKTWEVKQKKIKLRVRKYPPIQILCKTSQNHYSPIFFKQRDPEFLNSSPQEMFGLDVFIQNRNVSVQPPSILLPQWQKSWWFSATHMAFQAKLLHYYVTGTLDKATFHSVSK